MLWNYGRGRAEQFRLHPTPRSALNLVPPLFCLFLVLLPFLPRYFDWVLAAYGAVLFLMALPVLPLKKWCWLPWIMSLVFVIHICYGLGFWRGCLTRPKPPAPSVAAEVRLEKL
jgi:hypothetical protein